jgi:hypothetical protein
MCFDLSIGTLRMLVHIIILNTKQIFQDIATHFYDWCLGSFGELKDINFYIFFFNIEQVSYIGFVVHSDTF